MEKPDNYVIVTLSGQMDCETISKIRRRMELRECYDEHLRRAFEDPPEKRGPVGYHSSNNLIFPPRDESEPAKPIVSVTITPEEESVFTKLVKGRNGDNKVRLRRFADLYNGGLTWKEIEEQLSISPPTIENLKKKAEAEGLIDEAKREENRNKRKEEKAVGRVIKGDQVQEIDKPDLPEIEAKAEDLRVAGNISGVDTQPEPTPESDPIDVDAIIAEMEAAARDASQMLMLTEDHRDAAAQVVRILGAERAAEIVKAIHQQLKRELAVIWRQEAVERGRG